MGYEAGASIVDMVAELISSNDDTVERSAFVHWASHVCINSFASRSEIFRESITKSGIVREQRLRILHLLIYGRLGTRLA